MIRGAYQEPNQRCFATWSRGSEKPASALKMIDGVRSCHRSAGIFMVSTKQLTMMMKAEHIKKHGSEPAP